jgi:hypothetical protein
LALAAAALCAVMLALSAGTASAAPDCTLYAAPPPSGSAGGTGTLDKPYGSVQQLANSMAPGDVGCLLSGAVFNETVDIRNRPGTADKPFIIQSEDFLNPATISAKSDPATQAVVYIGSTTSHFALSGVKVHAQPNVGTPAITIAGDSNEVDGADVTNEGNGTCVQIGPSPDRRATNARLDGDAIHGCGNPSGGHADGVGISYADGTKITNNYITGNPRHGITMYPDAQGSQISHNVIDRQRNGMGDGEGVQFAGDANTASSNNVVEGNLISDNETVNIGFNWNDGSGTPGSGNVVRGNCISNSANANGNYQTAAGTQQPVGYTQEGNTNSDPQYVSRDAGTPAGYALSPSSPCRGLGPVASVQVGPSPYVSADPETRPVFSAFLIGELNTHLQPATYHFEVGRPAAGPPLEILPVQSMDPFPLPLTVSDNVRVRLKPRSTYTVRLVPDTPAGSMPSAPLTFRTGAAPKLAPPIPTVAYNTSFTKRGVALSQLSVSHLVTGTEVTTRCFGSRCPFAKRKGLKNIRLLRGRPFKVGTRIQLDFDPDLPVGRYRGREIVFRFGKVNRRHPARSLVRSDACTVFGGSPVHCLRPVAQFVSYPKYLQFTRFFAEGVPAGATLDYRCVRGRCPRFPGCRAVGKGFKNIPLLTKAARRKVKPGAVFDVRVLKLDTSGLVNRFTIQRRAGRVVAVQRSFFVKTSVQHHGTCPDA